MHILATTKNRFHFPTQGSYNYHLVTVLKYSDYIYIFTPNRTNKIKLFIEEHDNV